MKFEKWIFILILTHFILILSFASNSRTQASRTPTREVISSIEKVNILINKQLAIHEMEVIDRMDDVRFFIKLSENKQL